MSNIHAASRDEMKDDRQRVWLRFGEHDVELGPETVIGRSPRCQIVIDDPLVSRSHARLVVHRGTVTVEDLDSANGVLVNGERLTRARVLVAGDRLLIGSQSFELLMEGAAGRPQRERRFAKTLANRQELDGVGRTEPEPGAERSEATTRGDTFELLSSVADKALALGRGDEAERVLASFLRNLLQNVRAGAPLDPVMAERASIYAVRLAEATDKGGWVDFAIELHSIAKRPLPAVVIDRLYETLRKLQPLSAQVFRQYLAVLRSVEAQFGPSDRFLMRRIEGLDALGVFR